ncbi:hypothetical protein G7054_g8587 [Neopestalotiopsis clavispora]|nr:hypothetical protein G7054_g8587 [Neopestalotiopsis clavispora]
MRLLQLGAGDQLTLTKYLTHDIPPYAILSHTWGSEEEEVLLQDIQGDAREDAIWRQTYGYRKILFCGQQAKRDGIQHFWVDTCCIDKRSSAELSESINKMFLWYQKAQKCYVYLADVPSGSENEETTEMAWVAAFRDSKWFQRGWTLQELLAPQLVEFFSASGQRLGDKMSLELLIHDITGIAIVALRGHPLSQFDENERMSWLSNRQTTRDEDMAYCMLGIFNVAMYCVYGEGRNNAEIRLRQTIANWPRAPSEVRLTLQSWFDKALKDFSQVAEILQQNDTSNSDTSISHTRLVRSYMYANINMIHSIRGHQDYRRSELLDDILLRLDSLFPADIQQENGSAREVFPGLAALHRFINSKQDDQSQKHTELRRLILFKLEEKLAERLNMSERPPIAYPKAEGSGIARKLPQDLWFPNLLDILQEYIAAERTRLENTRTPPQSIWLAATTLFEVLASRKLCSCDPVHLVSVYLCVSMHHNEMENGEFDLCLSTESERQEARIKTSAMPPKRARQSLLGRSRLPVQCLSADMVKSAQLPKDYRLTYQLERDTLWRLQPEQTNLQFDNSRLPISLAQILDQGPKITMQNTMILSVVLAYTVYQLDGTPWLKSPWDSSNVYFILTTSGQPLRPYIMAGLDQDMGESSAAPLGKEGFREIDLDEIKYDPNNQPSDTDNLPRLTLPRLIDLATILIELTFQGSIASLAETCGLKIIEDKKMQMGYRWYLASTLYDRLGGDLNVSSGMSSVLSACLEQTIGLGDDNELLDENEVSDIIFRRIVRPLEVDLEMYLGKTDIDDG